MTTNKIGIAETNISASQMSEFFRLASLQGNHINRTTFQSYLEHRNPFDKQERITFTVIGTGLTGVEWLTRLEACGHKPSDWARDIITKPDYDKNHRLEAGKEYKITLVFGKEIRKDSERTTANLKSFASREFGEQAVFGLKGELALLIREKFTNAELEAMGIYYIAVLHEPIIDSDGFAGVLNSRRDGGKSCVDAACGYPSGQWSDDGAFAFFAS